MFYLKNYNQEKKYIVKLISSLHHLKFKILFWLKISYQI